MMNISTVNSKNYSYPNFNSRIKYSVTRTNGRKQFGHVCRTIAMFTTLFTGCIINEPDYRHAVYDPCCPTTDTQFKDNISSYKNFNVMLHNLGLIDTTSIQWENIDYLKLKASDGSALKIENRGFPLKSTKDNMNIAIKKLSADNKKDSIIANINNGYGSIWFNIIETNVEHLKSIPKQYTYIWQGKKDSPNGNNRFALVDVSKKGLWDNIDVFERKGDKIILEDKNHNKKVFSLNSVEIFKREDKSNL